MNLTVEDLHVSYGLSHVLRGVSLSVSTGEVVALLGRNGAGKTTLLRGVVGLTRPNGGSARMGEVELRGAPVHRAARSGLVFVPSGRRTFGSLTVTQNLELAARSCRDRSGKWNPARVYDVFPALLSLADRRSAFLSGGEQQMLKIGRALVANPDIMLLDEPTEGLSPAVVEELGTWLELLRDEGLGILLAEQNAVFSLGHADRAYILEKGEIALAGTSTEIWSSEALRSALGVAVPAEPGTDSVIKP